MKLSKRLYEVAGFVTPGSKTAADVGTDHGYIPIYLVKEHIVEKAIAMDVNAGPLLRAENNITANKVSDDVAVRISDGLRELKPFEANSIIISGMGGLLINKILSDGISILRTADELILSPHSELSEVRRFLLENDFTITNEKIVKDEGKFYFIMHVVNGRDSLYSPFELEYGKYLYIRKDMVFLEYLKVELEKRNKIIQKLRENSDNVSRLSKINEEAELIMKGIAEYES